MLYNRYSVKPEYKCFFCNKSAFCLAMFSILKIKYLVKDPKRVPNPPYTNAFHINPSRWSVMVVDPVGLSLGSLLPGIPSCIINALV